MLNAHPDVCFPPESHFFRQYMTSRRRRVRLEKRGVDRFAELLRRDHYFPRLHLDIQDLLEPYMKGGREFQLLRVYQRMLKQYCTGEEAHTLGDKDPRFIDYLDALYVLIPEAKIIHVIRDPRDVLVSRIKANWSSVYSWWLHVFVYRAQLNLGRNTGQKKYGKNYMELQYEKLISDPEETLAGVCDHLGVSFHEAMLDFRQSAEKLVTEEETHWKKETMGPLLGNNTGKWRGVLSPWRVRLTETVCSEAFCDPGYLYAGPDVRISAWLKAALLVVRPFGWFFTLAYKFRSFRF